MGAVNGYAESRAPRSKEIFLPPLVPVYDLIFNFRTNSGLGKVRAKMPIAPVCNFDLAPCPTTEGVGKTTLHFPAARRVDSPMQLVITLFVPKIWAR